MKINIKLMLPMVASGILFSSCSVFEWSFKRKKEPAKVIAAPIARADTARQNGMLKPYREIITKNAVTDSGLFIVHRIADKYYFEIPKRILDQDFLIVNRIVTGPSNTLGMIGYAGDEINKTLVRFTLGPNNKLFIKKIEYNVRSSDSSENGMYRSLLKSNQQPIIAVFDVKTKSLDSASIVVEMTDYLKNENGLMGFDQKTKGSLKIGAIQSDKSYLKNILSFPLNTEIRTVKTYTSGLETVTYELNNSIVMLPRNPMRPRLSDGRVGYFSLAYKDFDANDQKIVTTEIINKWRLEPKPEDMQRYLKGELVEPLKPIVYYIDPTTPKRWVKYLIQGVNDWQKAFEKAGFKNAIYAIEAPKNDPNWSLEDVRHNAIVYKPSEIANASGPHIHDPRTGEILESHINWYHNVMQLLHNWYMVQVGPNDPRARKITFDDELMGTLIRFVSSHEVGHTLGLEHNFAASSSIPVEKLRNKKWVEENGFCPSIMDYARFNYVAQPEDHISERGLMPRIGVYDEWAIEWGYRLQPAFDSRREEKLYNNQLIKSRIDLDARLKFWPEETSINSQSEDLGDNAMKASTYGIMNLKRVMKALPQWMYEPGETRWEYKLMRDEVVKQYLRYVGHVIRNLNGSIATYKTMDQPGPLWAKNPKVKMVEAMHWVQKEVFSTPAWMLDKSLREYVDPMGSGSIGEVFKIQDDVLGKLFNVAKISSLVSSDEGDASKIYTSSEYLRDLKNGIWAELGSPRPISTIRMRLQNSYVFRLGDMLVPSGNYFDLAGKNQSATFYRYSSQLGAHTIIKEHAQSLLAEVQRALPQYKDKPTRDHLKRVAELLRIAISGKVIGGDTGAQPEAKPAASTGESFGDNKIIEPRSLRPTDGGYGCWTERPVVLR